MRHPSRRQFHVQLDRLHHVGEGADRQRPAVAIDLQRSEFLAGLVVAKHHAGIELALAHEPDQRARRDIAWFPLVDAAGDA
jgi:hypothetical protein